MPMVLAKCTQCGSVLQVDGQRDAAICQHCGAAFVVERAVQNYSVQNFITAGTVNVYGGQQDFVVRAGMLEKYQGAAVDVVIPDTVTIIGDGAFEGCVGLRTVKIPDTVTVIGASAFSNCTGLTDVFMGRAVKEIGKAVTGGNCGNAFAGCTSLSYVELPEGLQTLEQASFFGCESLLRISLPRSLRSVGRLCFGQCSELREVVIGSAQTQFEYGAFGVVRPGDWRGVSANLTNVQLPPGVDPERYYTFFHGTPWRRAEFARQGRCTFCGGSFTGLFRKVCRNCRRPKAY